MEFLLLGGEERSFLIISDNYRLPICEIKNITVHNPKYNKRLRLHRLAVQRIV